MSASSETAAACKKKSADPQKGNDVSQEEAPPWESPQWQEAVSQNPGLAPFFDNFHAFGQSEFGLTYLRKLVLWLAFRGKLVAQDGKDEPAAETLRKFNERQEEPTKKRRETGRAATTSVMPGISAISIGDAKMPTVPGWEWMPLTGVARLETGHTPSRKKPEYWDGEIDWIGIKDARHNHGKVISKTFQTVTQLGLDNSASRLLPANTVCLSRTASVGYVIVMGKPMATSQDFVNWVCSDAVDSEFLMYLLIAENESLLRFSKGTTHRTIYFPEVKAFRINVPPLAEQRRIVSKVEGLMSLCDTLESHRRARESVRERASRSVLVRLTSAPRSDHSERQGASRRSSTDDVNTKQPTASALSLTGKTTPFAEPLTQPTAKGETCEPQVASLGYQVSGEETLASAWHRLSDHFEVLLDQPLTVPHLRQSILQLAVQGKLVPQDPSDEPAPDESKETKLPAIADKETPFALPISWKWRRLGSLADFINGDRGKNYPNKSEYVKEGIAFMNTGHIEPDGSLCLNSMNYITREKFDTLRSGKIQPGDLVYCLRGATIGKTARVDPFTEGAIASSLVIIRVDGTLDRDYAYTFLRSPLGYELISRFDNGSAQPNLGAKSLNLYVTPTPPLAEQKRIVSKVSVLLSQCDELSARLRSRQSTTDALLTALIHQILE